MRSPHAECRCIYDLILRSSMHVNSTHVSRYDVASGQALFLILSICPFCICVTHLLCFAELARLLF
jgi:hypothetical protein